MNERVSVIICTADRHNSLRKTLESLEKSIYKNLEIIVVDASLSDDTLKLINEISANFLFVIKFAKVSQRNISVSRNVGIRLATKASIIAFIDDDAIAPPEWIEELLATYIKYGEKCAGVGGAVRDMTTPGNPLQYRRGITNIISTTIPVRPKNAPDYNQSKSFWYSALMGANSSYRKVALDEIGGYDEFFDYFLDETDVCLRIIQAGYQIHHSDVVVDHYPARSHNREDQKHLTCWYSLAKNTTYFAIKYGYNRIPPIILVIRLTLLLAYRCFARILRLRLTHNLPFSIIWKYINESIHGIRVGWEAGFALYASNDIIKDYSITNG